VLLFSLAASAINEFIVDNLLNLWGKILAKAICKLLEQKPAFVAKAATENKPCVDLFCQQPEIKRLTNRGRLPSAIEPRR
jgi:hypothetical protein